MSINSIQGLGVNPASQTSQATSSNQVEANKSDASWFSAALEPTSKTQQTGNVAERIVGQLSNSSEHLQKLSADADRALKKASKSSDPQDVVQANRALSSFYLESLLTTKLISKGTQTIEKLTSLQ